MQISKTLRRQLGCFAAAGALLWVGACSTPQEPPAPAADAPPAEAEVKEARPAAPEGSEVVVTVNGRAYTLDDFLAYWQKLDTRPLWNKANLTAAVDRLANDKLIAKLAREDEGFADWPGLHSKIQSRVGSLWRDLYWSKVVEPSVTYTREEVLESMPPMTPSLTVRQLLLGDRATIEALRNRVVEGEDFEAIIRQHSEGMSRDRGGVSENIRPTSERYTTEVLQKMFSMPLDELSEVHSTPIGFLVFRVESEITVEDQLTRQFPRYESKLREQRARELWAAELDRLVASHEVEVHEDTVDQYQELTGDSRRLTPILRLPLVTVDGQDFLLGDVIDPSGSGVVHGTGLAEDLVNRAVENFAIRAEAKRIGLANPEIERTEEYLTDNLTARQYIEYRGTQLAVSEDDITGYYEEMKDEEFRRPEARRFSVIETRNLGRVAQIYEELTAGTPFDRVAMKWSDHGSSAKGGDVGYLEMDKLDPRFERLRDLHLEQYLEKPLELDVPGEDFNLYIIAQLTDVQEAGYKPLDPGVAGTIANRLLTWKRKGITGTILQELRDADNEVVVNSEVLERYRVSLPEPSEEDRNRARFTH